MSAHNSSDKLKKSDLSNEQQNGILSRKYLHAAWPHNVSAVMAIDLVDKCVTNSDHRKR